MKVRNIVLAAALTVFPGVASAYDDNAIKAKCDAEWGTDFAMVNYCRDQQRTAGENYDRFKEQAADNATSATILAHCEGEWAADYSMVMHCSDQQVTALQTLSTIPLDVPANIAEAIRGQCASDWGNDFSMVAYCVNQQTTAWRSLQ